MSSADPTDIFEASPTELGIVWSDGHRSVYTLHHLRTLCPCASCNDLRAKFGPLLINKETIRLKGLEPVGRYALQFLWSDGHQTGIYGWEFLRYVCPCEECAKRAAAK